MRLEVIVKPNSSKTSIEKKDDGAWVICVTAPPIDNKANKALIEVLANYFHKPKSKITIIRGEKGRKKLIEIS